VSNNGQVKGAKADVYYGATGTHKTSNLGKAAVWAMKKFGKSTRLVSADGGGWEPIDSLVEAGIVIPWQIRDRKFQIESIDQACQGYWPRDPTDPTSELIAPFSITYEGTCSRCGHVMKATVAPRQQAYPCSKCKELNPPITVPVVIVAKRTPNPENNLTEVAMVEFEGLTSFGDLMLSHLMRSKASLSQDPSYVWEDGTTAYAGGNQTYYGFVQQRLQEFVMKSNMLPVEKVVWTALEGKGIDDLTKAPIFGPSIVGKQATGKAGAWFGAMLHFEACESLGAVEQDPTLKGGVVKINSSVRMYLRNHADAFTKVMFPAKTRAPYMYGSQMPEYMETDVEKLYNQIDQLKEKALTEVRQIKESKAGTVQP
jgi:hypothetical protein